MNVIFDGVEMSKRTYNCLQKIGINKLADLSNWTETDLLCIKGLGDNSLEEIIAICEEKNIILRDDDYEYDPKAVGRRSKRPIKIGNLRPVKSSKSLFAWYDICKNQSACTCQCPHNRECNLIFGTVKPTECIELLRLKIEV